MGTADHENGYNTMTENLTGATIKTLKTPKLCTNTTMMCRGK
jgi:hypothetical protein